MAKNLRTGIAVSLFLTSIVAAATLILNPRFADKLLLGSVLLLGLPVVGGLVLGGVLGRWLCRLAEIGTNEDPVRAHELLWAAITSLGVFLVTMPMLPPFLALFTSSETLRYGGALVLAIGLAYLAGLIARYVANRYRLWIWPLLLALPVTALLLGATPWGRGTGPGSRVLVLAFPGMSWSVAEDLIEAGEMPNLTALRRTGAWGDLEGVPPFLSQATWTTIAAGKTSDDHQVLSLHATADDVQVRRIWEIFADRGWSIGLFGWPVTWPPEIVDGFIVPGVSDLGTEAYPDDLGFIRELAMSEKTNRPKSWGRYWRYAFLGIRYGARLGTLMEAGMILAQDFIRGGDLNAAELFAKRKLRAKLNCDHFVELRRRLAPDFCAFHTNIVHVAQAHFWKYHEPASFPDISPEDIDRYGESVHDSYRIMDEFIGRIMDDTAPDDLVVVISDHSAEAIPDGAASALTMRLEPMLTATRLKTTVEGTNLGARTFIRMKPGYAGNLNRVRRLFETARLADGKTRVFNVRVDEWDNLVVTVQPQVRDWFGDVILFQGGRCLVTEVIRDVEFQESAQMRGTGALVLHGKGVKPSSRFDQASTLDLVPTLLVLTGLDLAADLPGDVIDTVLEESLRRKIPGVVATYETMQKPSAAEASEISPGG